MKLLAGFLALVMMLVPFVVQAEKLPQIRVAALKFGTVMWELETIRHHGLDRQNGFQLAVIPVAGKQAAAVMLQAGDADAIVSDWLWAARQWPAGRQFLAVPYSRAVGGVVVQSGGVRSLAELKGKRIGIAGGALDKNWLMLRAVVRKMHGFDPAEHAQPAFASPPIIHKKMLSGAFDAAVNFWHYQARARSAGMAELVTTQGLIQQAGLPGNVPLLAYVFSGGFTENNSDLVAAFSRSSRAAKKLLVDDAAAWQAVRPRMKAKTDAEFQALKSGYLAGRPASSGWPDVADMQAWVDFLRANGGQRLIGPLKTVPSALFYRP